MKKYLLRPDQVLDLPGAARHPVPDDSHVGHQATATGTVIPLDHRGAGANACPPGALRARIPPPVGSSFLLCGGLMSRPAGRSPHLILRVLAGVLLLLSCVVVSANAQTAPGRPTRPSGGGMSPFRGPGVLGTSFEAASLDQPGCPIHLSIEALRRTERGVTVTIRLANLVDGSISRQVVGAWVSGTGRNDPRLSEARERSSLDRVGLESDGPDHPHRLGDAERHHRARGRGSARRPTLAPRHERAPAGGAERDRPVTVATMLVACAPEANTPGLSCNLSAIAPAAARQRW